MHSSSASVLVVSFQKLTELECAACTWLVCSVHKKNPSSTWTLPITVVTVNIEVVLPRLNSPSVSPAAVGSLSVFIT